MDMTSNMESYIVRNRTVDWKSLKVQGAYTTVFQRSKYCLNNYLTIKILNHAEIN